MIILDLLVHGWRRNLKQQHYWCWPNDGWAFRRWKSPGCLPNWGWRAKSPGYWLPNPPPKWAWRLDYIRVVLPVDRQNRGWRSWHVYLPKHCLGYWQQVLASVMNVFGMWGSSREDDAPMPGQSCEWVELADYRSRDHDSVLDLHLRYLDLAQSLWNLECVRDVGTCIPVRFPRKLCGLDLNINVAFTAPEEPFLSLDLQMVVGGRRTRFA